jgi:hypothetical protein
VTSKKKIDGLVVLTLLGIFGGGYALYTVALYYLEGRSGIDSNNNSSTMSSSPQQQPAGQPVQQQPSSRLSDPQALVREVRAYMQQQGWNTTQADPKALYYEPWYDTNMTKVAEGIVKSKYRENNAFIIITARTGQCWSGFIMGSDHIPSTWDGCGTGYRSLRCSGVFGSYSLAMQRSSEGYGTDFLVQVWKGGELLKQGRTLADYGVVSFAGSC